MVSYAMLSKPGGRSRNEDCVCMYGQAGDYVFALADGLGGHGGGDVASFCAVDQAIDIFRKTGGGEDYLREAFESAQGRILQTKAAQGKTMEMKSTMVLLTIQGQRAQWAHIGDSRLYYFQGNHIVKRTLDHSVPQMLVLGGKIKESEIRNHVDRNKVLRVLGTPWEGASYEISSETELGEEQGFLLCTDGFWELITEKEMEKTLKQSRSVAQWLHRMEEIVCKRGKDRDMDNYSAVCVYIDG